MRVELSLAFDSVVLTIGSPIAMLVYKRKGQNIQILNKTVIAITLHVYVLIACDERRQSLHILIS